MSKVTDETVAALEKIYAAEIEGRLPFQSSAAIYKRLEALGAVERSSRQIPVPPLGEMTVSGWGLTHAGRLYYCTNCDGSAG